MGRETQTYTYIKVYTCVHCVCVLILDHVHLVLLSSNYVLGNPWMIPYYAYVVG